MTPLICPACAWPIHGQHHVDDAGVSWHLGCWESQARIVETSGTAPVETDGLDFWAEKE